MQEIQYSANFKTISVKMNEFKKIANHRTTTVSKNKKEKH